MRPHPADAAMTVWIWGGIAIVAAIVCLAVLLDLYERFRRRVR
ncbi:MAG: hypothetical protein ACRDN9_03265 [Streptosporangiaceae bacterium]